MSIMDLYSSLQGERVRESDRVTEKETEDQYDTGRLC